MNAVKATGVIIVPTTDNFDTEVQLVLLTVLQGKSSKLESVTVKLR